MKKETFHVQFITPCFCAGENPVHGEFRAPSIRGELRWWFRALGGTTEQECRLFGGTANDENGRASAVAVRTLGTISPGDGKWPGSHPPRGRDILAYLFFFVDRTQRWKKQAALSPQSRYGFQLQWRRSIHQVVRNPSEAQEVQDLWELTLDSFLTLGSLGFRTTRGAGAFWCVERPARQDSLKSLAARLEDRGFTVCILSETYGENDWRRVMARAAKILREQLRPGNSAKRRDSPLGRDKPRQTSAVRFRPVRVEDHLQLAVWEAPHERVLGPNSRRREHILKTVPITE